MDLPLWLSPTWYVIGAAVIGAMLYYYFGGARQRLLEQFADDRDPVRRWAKGVFGLISGGIDYGHSDQRDVYLALREWWGINDAQQFRVRYSELYAAQSRSKPEAAWCWVRAVNLARMAAGARFISNDESWQLIARVLPRIQSSFTSWEDLGQSYLAAWGAWLRARNIDPQKVESVEESIQALRQGVWRKVAFSQPLELGQAGGRTYTRRDKLRVVWYVVAGAIDLAIRFRILLLIVAFVIAAAMLLAQSFLSAASAEKDLVGSWVGELVESGSIDGKKYDTRRWLMLIRPDGTASQTMRWYLGRQRQEEAVEQFEWAIAYGWSVKGLVWRQACKEISPGYQCENRSFKVSIDQDELRYANMSGRVGHTMRRVSADYRLP
jgi:Protein of unknown function (DUF1266)